MLAECHANPARVSRPFLPPRFLLHPPIKPRAAARVRLVSFPDHPKVRWSWKVSRFPWHFQHLRYLKNHVIANASHVPVLCQPWNSLRLKPVHAKRCRHIPSSFHNSSTASYPCYYLHTYGRTVRLLCMILTHNSRGSLGLPTTSRPLLGTSNS